MARFVRLELLSATVAVMSCASANAAPIDFAGEYRATTKLADDTYQDNVLSIGPAINGRATIEGVFPQGKNACSVEGEAQVNEAGLAYRQETGRPEGPFVLMIEIARGEATISQVSGPPDWNCGANALWSTVTLLRNAKERNRKSYERAVECHALYEFLAARERARRGETERAQVFDGLATIADLYVGQFADASRIQAPDQATDEASAGGRLTKRSKDGKLGASTLKTEEDACNRAAHGFFVTRPR